MAKALRVFELAKQLGVESKDIVAKCDAEDIPNIKNHMSTVSLGLAETIREWFSEGGSQTAVEVAAPVDLAKARAKVKRKATRKKSDAPSDETEQQADAETETSAATAEATTKPTAARKASADPTESSSVEEAESTEVSATQVESPSKPPAAAQQTGSPPAEETVDAASSAPPAKSRPAERDLGEEAEDTKAVPAPPSTESTGDREVVRPAATIQEVGGRSEQDPVSRPKPIMNVPQRPKIVKPVGPRLESPVATKLSGPKVIRVESPDPVPPPRPRSGEHRGDGPIMRSGPRGGRGAAMDGPPDMDPSRGGPGAGRSSRRNKRRTGDTPTPARRTGRAATGTPGGGSGDGQFNWREQDLLEREERLNRSGGFFRSHRRDNLKRTGSQRSQRTSAGQSSGPVKVSEPIVIKELSAATGVKVADIIKKLFLSGSMATINSAIETEKAIELMLEFGIELEVAEQVSAESRIERTFAERTVEDERPRPPVVTILGHVDHGKTSLLDRIRNANVAEGEAGGITQATSAFRVPVKSGDSERVVVFFDTPGHEAFTEMRARGAKVTDIVVLVVAADDGVMPQTLESINHAKAAGVPIVVALNKIDKPEATDSNIQRILGQLAEHGLNPVEWGGSTEVIRTSAISGDGVQDLLEMLDYQSDLLELKAGFGGFAQGSVIEAQLEEGRGPVARILVQQGMLRKGDFIVVGRAFGRVRDIVNDRSERIETAGPSTPVAISGIDLLPDAGDKFYCVKTLKEAEAAAEERRGTDRQRDLAAPKVTLDNIFSRMAEGQKKELRLIVKADVQGSVETLKKSLEQITTDEVSVNVLHSAVGGVNESDVTLAAASGAIVIGFNVTTSSKARQHADDKGIDIRLYDVIYDITDDVIKAAQGLLDPEHRLEVLGHAEVRQVFRITRVGMIAGCYVTDGVIERNSQIRVTRDGIVVEKDRRLEQLKRFKDDVKEVRSGQECGMKIDGYDDIKAGDVLECYKTIEVQRTL